jgi:endonuclease/exonuclease/phosphatase family metal-dependent hydrolase
MPTHTFQVISFNLWHGLNHTKPFLMPPAEDWTQKKARDSLFHETIRNLKAQSPGIFCFQEVNPVSKKTKIMKESLGLEGHFGEGNVGIRLGNFSYPPLLQEGLATLFTSEFTPLGPEQSKRIVLSGDCFDSRAPILNSPFTFQLKERRIALFCRLKWQNLTFVVVNTHIHHGNPKWKASGDRRLSELTSLFQNLDVYTTPEDLVLLCGDFNCYPGLPEYDLILQKGFQELSLNQKSKESIITWDPSLNPVCQNSVELSQDPLAREWDEQKNAFDHIYLKTPESRKGLLKNVATERIFDKPNSQGIFASDHFGIRCELSFDSSSAY